MRSAGCSAPAERDLVDIAAYTSDRWGEAQAFRYIAELKACAALLAREPDLGRSCEPIRKGLLRFEQGKHVLFYRKRAGGITVFRILHERMQPESYFRERQSRTK